jgi:glycosyltransferase involved in cell wall biosynthesis
VCSEIRKTLRLSVVRIRYLILNAYAFGGTVRTVVNQANAMCVDHEVEIASVYRHREEPGFRIDPRVRLIPLTDLRGDGKRRTDPPDKSSRLMSKTRRFRNPLPHGPDHRFRRWDPVVDFHILRYLRSVHDGILVTTRPGLNLLSARAAHRDVIRVAQDHMNLGTYKPALRESIVRTYPRVDAVTVLTRHDLQDYRQALQGSNVRLECIPNGIPAWPFPPAALDSKVLIAAGRLVKQKGFDLLLDAFAKVSARHPDWQLWIFGSGASQNSLAAQIDRLGLTGRAHLKGTTGQLDKRLAESSVFVLSSRFEGLPMVLLEAMTAGLPAVSFDCPTGPAEVIEHGRSGLLLPPQDVDALAAAICDLIENPARRKAMGAAALKAAERYSMSTVGRMWEQLFAELVDARRPDRMLSARR